MKNNILVRLFIVAIFLIATIIIINSAPQYELTYKYKDGDLRVIFDNVELTRDIRKMPESAVFLNGEVLLSQNTIDILFDKNLYYEEKYDTLITTSDHHRADLKVDSKIIEIDGEENGIKVPAIRERYDYSKDDRYLTTSKESKNVIYIPIKALENVYDIDVEFKDKLIITSRNANIYTAKVPSGQVLNLKYLEDEKSKTIKQVPENDSVTVFNYDNSKTYNIARTSDGELGYALTSTLEEFNINQIAAKKEEEKNTRKIKMAWDYINPDYSSIGDKSQRSRISNLDIVSPTLLTLQNTNGEVTYRINAVKEYTKWAQSAGYEIWVTFKNDGKTIDETSQFLNDMKHRKTAIKELLDFVESYKVNGINIDFENMYKDDAEVFSQFIRELSVETKQKGIILSVCVNIPDGSDTWSKCYQHKILSEAADYLTVMTYDCRNNLSSYASYDWVEENIQKLVERDGIDGSKLVLGIAFDSSYWKTTNGKSVRSVYYMNSAKKYLNNATWNDKAKQYYYENSSKQELIWIEEKASISEKLKLIEQYGLAGSACWCLGQETEDVWSAFN